MANNIDRAVEDHALRELGILGRGGAMGNLLYALDYDRLPPEARAIVQMIANGGPFLHPEDGRPFGNRFGDLPRGDYLEFTVPTPSLPTRGKRRLVARSNGILFFTACHYERVQGGMTVQARRAATLQIDEQWRNGFYVVTGLPPELAAKLRTAISSLFLQLRGRLLDLAPQASRGG
jgi:ribonuclease T1